jgi:branched-chain amino acid transport system ATP-binding protein
MSMILETRNLGIRFGGVVALEGLDLQIEKEEILGVIGPNGAGKTTLLNLITGIYPPTSGQILFKGKKIEGLAPHKIAALGISRTFQNIRLIPALSVLENVMLGRALHVKESPLDSVLLHSKVKAERSKWISFAEEILESVGLGEVIDIEAISLPYGKQRTVEIARAIATGAEILLLDEPGAGMSKQEKETLVNFIGNLRKGMKKTIVLIEHDVKMVLNVVDRVVVLDFGVKIADEAPEAVKLNPKVIEAYLGAEAT